MATERINYRPRFIPELVKTGLLDGSKLAVVDVGARYGAESVLASFGDKLYWIGFEPDAEECRRINERLKGLGGVAYPFALHRDGKEREFYRAVFEAASGYYRNNQEFWGRFDDGSNLEVAEIQIVKPVTLDEVAAQTSLKAIDFIKLDVEGAELDVLKGGERAIHDLGVLGIAAESRFDSIISRQRKLDEPVPTFAEMDQYLRRMGFMLYDLEPRRHSRKCLPVITPFHNAKFERVPGPSDKGQVIWADTVYFRDAVGEVRSGKTELADFWNRTRVLKLACLFEAYGLNDCAIELLMQFRESLLRNLPVHRYLDLLAPKLHGKSFGLSEYVGYVNKENSKPPREKPYVSDVLEDLGRDCRRLASATLPQAVKRFIKTIFRMR